MPNATPSEYGRWWNETKTGPEWYRQLFEPRRAIHEAFMEWTRSCSPLADVLEVGCGCAIVYPDFFSASRYTGVDISQKEIDWSRKNDQRSWHSYFCGDFTTMVGSDSPIKPASFDLVFAHAVIDHVPDIDGFVSACLRASRGWIYLTAYRGWFPNIEHHRQMWDPTTTCFYNDVSHRMLRASQPGTSFSVTRGPVVNPQNGPETIIVAKTQA